MTTPVEYAAADSVPAVPGRTWLPTWASTLRIRRFALVGVANTLVDYLLFVALTKIMRLPLDWVWVAKILSGTAAISTSFYLNRTWVFRASGSSLPQAGRFFVTAIIGVYGIQTALTQLFASSRPEVGEGVYSLLQRTGIAETFPSVLTEPLAIKTAAFVLATSVSMTFNYLMYRFWVFGNGTADPALAGTTESR
jgi:putative flippase GtrA